MSDPAKYRTREEVDAMRKQHDPIDQLREVLGKQDVTEDELKSIDADVKAVVLRATEFAQTSPEPDPSELFTDILLPASDRDSRKEA
jgi:pyruvate dehydrogenase E1 component alpha subunit